MANKQKISGVRGMDDLLPAESELFTHVENTARQIFARYGFQEIRTPLVEPTELFVRGVGESSDIVGKEMYTFLDRNQVSLSLRPEGTASVVRAYVAANLSQLEALTRLYYMGPMFRYERPQKGRTRQFYQIGLEVFGITAPAADVDVITLGHDLLKELLPKNKIELQINSLGCGDCRPAFQKKLIEYLSARAEKLCEDCQRRLQKNPMRVFDCKNEACQAELKSAPVISGAWCEVCSTHYAQVKQGLQAANVSFVENPRIVRGLDYYMRTAFEFLSADLGAQSAVGAGGRYDGLVASLGGAEVPGVGMAFGVERLVMLLQQQNVQVPKPETVFLAVISEAAISQAIQIVSQLRRAQIAVQWDFEAKSLKSQMKKADKVAARWVVMLGEDELKQAFAVVRNMQTKEQNNVPFAELVKFFQKNGEV